MAVLLLCFFELLGIVGQGDNHFVHFSYPEFYLLTKAGGELFKILTIP
jgi:hypothetical protein